MALLNPSQQLCEMGTVTIPTSEKRKLRFGKLKVTQPGNNESRSGYISSLTPVLISVGTNTFNNVAAPLCALHLKLSVEAGLKSANVSLGKHNSENPNSKGG